MDNVQIRTAFLSISISVSETVGTNREGKKAQPLTRFESIMGRY